ncbi:MAG: aminoglycoside phosphotransferase family protein [Chloroflexi bacterium]|nr:aminoglycoside phosphotransferase family protein [Chloroflexota bacterium]
MSSRKVVADFLKREAWHLVQYIGLGTTAHIFVVKKDNERYVLKTRRDGDPDTCALLAEYRVLRYLNSTPMQRYVPGVGEWLPEPDGFLMKYLRYPTEAEKEAADWVPNLARALQTLHSVNLPSIQGIADDRPNVGTAISKRFRDLFQVVLRADGFWGRLPREDESKLERVRAYYPTYVGLLSQIADSLTHPQLALTHGDLAGDNIMLTQDGRLAIADWGAARISAALADVASLSTYTNWSEDERRQFFRVYLSNTSGAHEEASLCLEVLSRLHKYRSCVQSLLWLNEEGEEGLDAIGRAHFERQLSAL